MAEIKAVLLAVLSGEAFLADKPWSETWWGHMHLDLASGWRLRIAIERKQLGVLLWALAPDGRDWEYGCQRNDWTLGPDSQIVEPLALLTPDQRHDLDRLLRQACCWPARNLPVGLVFPSGEERLSPRRRPCRTAKREQRKRPS